MIHIFFSAEFLERRFNELIVSIYTCISYIIDIVI